MVIDTETTEQTDLMKFLYRSSKSASVETLIDLQFSFPIAGAISVIVSPRSICYLFNNCKMKVSGTGDSDPFRSFTINKLFYGIILKRRKA